VRGPHGMAEIGVGSRCYPAGKKEKRKEKNNHLRMGAAARAAGAAAAARDLVADVEVPSSRERMWRDGPAIVTMLTGYPKDRARSLLGKMLSKTNRDCIRSCRYSAGLSRCAR
jgi:hypothetical protein